MSGSRASVVGRGTATNAEITNHNQPMDLAQKVTSRNSDTNLNVKGGSATVVHYATQYITQKPGVRGDGLSGQPVAFVSRTSSNTSSGGGAALNLVNSGQGSTTGTLRAVSHSSNSSSTSSFGYHIPRGAAAVANMAAPRSQAVAAPIVRSANQSQGLRGNIGGQRVVPITTNGGWARNSPPALTTKASTTPSSIGSTRSTLHTNRPGHTANNTITTFHPGGMKTGSVTTAAVRGPGTSAIRGSIINNDGSRNNSAKQVHITQPLVQPQKYASNLSSIRCMTTSSVTAVTSSIYSPSNPLVTTLAASGTTISHAGLRGPSTPIAVRITTASLSTATASSQIISQAGNNSSVNSSNNIQISHPHQTSHPRNQVTTEHIPLKTPIVRTPVHSTSKCGGQYTQGPKVITQPAQGPPVALAHISNLAGVTTQKVGSHHGHTVSRTGGVNNVGRVNVTGASIPIAKVLPQIANASGLGTTIHSTSQTGGVSHSTVNATGTNAGEQQLTGVYRTSHNAAAATITTVATTQGDNRSRTGVSQYNLATPYYFESSSQNSYSVSGTLVPHSLPSSHFIPGGVSAGPLRVSGAAVVDNPTPPPPPQPKHNSSPRPSILRRRHDADGAPMKAAKNLTSALSVPLSSPPSPKRPDSRGNGNASSGSTTISANSSPGLQIEECEGGNIVTVGRGMIVKTPTGIKQEPMDDATTLITPRHCISDHPIQHVNNGASLTAGAVPINIPQLNLAGATLQLPTMSDGLSPRKKPRKQQLNELLEARSSEDDFELPLQKKVKQEVLDHQDMDCSEEELVSNWSSDGVGMNNNIVNNGNINNNNKGNESNNNITVIINKPTMNLLHCYRQSWKARHNHFTRHSDVRPKEEKKHTVNEMANQKMALQRVNGWKVMHLTGQLEDIVDLESEVVQRFHVLLNVLEKNTTPKKPYKDFDKDVNRLSELVKANIQRSKILGAQMTEAKSQMRKLFDHKERIVDIMNKYSNKRNIRKKEKT